MVNMATRNGYRRLLRATLLRALQDAEAGDLEAQEWLVSRPAPHVRELILAYATTIDQDWLDCFVRRCKRSTPDE